MINDWENKKLKNFSKVVTGSTPPTNVPEYYGKNYPFVSPGDLGIAKYIYKSEKGLSELGLQQTRSLPKGSILFTCIGSTIGKMGIAGTRLATNQQINAIICDETVHNEYIFYALLIRANRIKKLAGTQAVPIINKSTFENELIPLPPLPEQCKIAEILSTWDEAITKTEQLIAALRERKMGLMQRLLTGQVRFAGFDTDWKEIKLGDVFTERKERGSEHLPLLSVSENGITYRDESNRRDTSGEDKSKYLRICPGDIGYNTMRMWQGRSALSQYEGIVSPAYTVLTPVENIDVRFMAYLFKYPPMVHAFYRYSQGLVSDTWSLKFPVFSKIQARIPEYEEQKRIADMLMLCDKQIEETETYFEKLQHQKKGLMQRLLTGEVRVKV